MVYCTISSSGISSNGLHHCYACRASASRKTVADANRDKLINACASARHANTNTDGQRHTVTVTADTNRNTHLHPAYGNSNANTETQCHAATAHAPAKGAASWWVRNTDFCTNINPYTNSHTNAWSDAIAATADTQCAASQWD